MHWLSTPTELEAVMGSPSAVARMKSVSAFDDGSRTALERSPIAAVGYRTASGEAMTSLVGGTSGFARAKSPRVLTVDLDPATWSQLGDGAVSLLFLIPGVGETLRVNGTAHRDTASTIAVELGEMFVHCAKSVLRSQLWSGGRAVSVGPPDVGPGGAATGSPLADPAIGAFLQASPFLMISSWDRSTGDTSPRGDRAGFARIMTEGRLIVPERSGNRRTDTLHNLLFCEDVSMIFLRPGSSDLLHVRGRAHVTNDPMLCAESAIGGKPAVAVLVVDVDHAAVELGNPAAGAAGLWDRTTHATRQTGPNLIRVQALHVAGNRAPGRAAAINRMLFRRLAASEGLAHRTADEVYRRELRDEGYTQDPTT